MPGDHTSSSPNHPLMIVIHLSLLHHRMHFDLLKDWRNEIRI
jgi:hypothetical protein